MTKINLYIKIISDIIDSVKEENTKIVYQNKLNACWF